MSCIFVEPCKSEYTNFLAVYLCWQGYLKALLSPPPPKTGYSPPPKKKKIARSAAPPNPLNSPQKHKIIQETLA